MPEPLTAVSPLVVVIGPVNTDHIADAFPSPGETLLGRTAHVALGGRGPADRLAAGDPLLDAARPGIAAGSPAVRVSGRTGLRPYGSPAVRVSGRTDLRPYGSPACPSKHADPAALCALTPTAPYRRGLNPCNAAASSTASWPG
ncbi:hypothetical protein [Streptomyces pacificus]|uniref:hypothetical protein n=1 Tax=Streptomyces pacificus TaxID=2705029 RepID=UPI0020B16214|nr:hypothetical protein [Streptomyces pacificus]